MKPQVINFENGISVTLEAGMTAQDVSDAVQGQGGTLTLKQAEQVLAGDTTAGYELIGEFVVDADTSTVEEAVETVTEPEGHKPDGSVCDNSCAGCDADGACTGQGEEAGEPVDPVEPVAPAVNPDVHYWIDLFARVNADCVKSGEQVVPITDVDYYTEQIFNLTEEADHEAAHAMAKQMLAEREKIGTICPAGEPGIQGVDGSDSVVTDGTDGGTAGDDDGVPGGPTGEDGPVGQEGTNKPQTKADKAREVFASMIGTEGVKPKDIKAAMAEVADLSKAGASTYYYNFKKALETPTSAE